MEELEIYKCIANLLWSIMPNNAKEIRFIGSVYPEHYSEGIEWTNKLNEIEYFPMGESPYEIEHQIRQLMFSLKEKDQHSWNHYIFSLQDNMEYSIKFAYIDEEDSWNGLYLKGVSDLTWEEACEYYIPKEIWEERVRIKNSKS